MVIKQYKKIDFDSAYAMEMAKENLKNKKCLHDNYVEMYRHMLELGSRYLKRSGGIELELGSGGGFFKDIYPGLLTSDVTDVNGVDMVVDAQHLPFEDNSVDIIYAAHVIHHIPDISLFLDEVMRVCPAGGGVSLRSLTGARWESFFIKTCIRNPMMIGLSHGVFLHAAR